jgi:hypothetical protein
MPSNIDLQIGQVVQTSGPIQFDQFTDEDNKELAPGAVRIRLRKTVQTPAAEITAIPANANFVNVPLYGEQVIVFSAISGLTEDNRTNQYYYMPAVSVHGQVNNNILPFIHDTRVSTTSYLNDGISSTKKTKVPEQLSFESRNIVTIQPYQGDTILQDRFGSALRFSSTHRNLSAYSQKPIWQGTKVGDPFISLTCGLDGAQKSGYFTIENPDKDSSLIYLSSTQKINNLKLAQRKIGLLTQPLTSYTDPQVIISSNRLIFNAREDELVLVSKKDIKLATPNWSVDVDNLITQFEALVTAITKMTHPTGVGPSGPPINVADFVKILTEIKLMKQ